MTDLKQLEEAVRQLTPDERDAFRAWFAEYDAGEWDRQLESDITSGRLDFLAEEAIRENRERRTTDR